MGSEGGFEFKEIKKLKFVAFTIEQIEKAFITNNEVARFYVDQTKISDSPNYNIIADYLTGKSNSLPRIQLDQSTYVWIQVLNLLNDIVNPTANDQLVLNVIKHPDLALFMNHFFQHWLLQYALKHNDKNSLQAVIGQFKSIGMNDDDVFNYFIANVHFDDEKDLRIENTLLKQFLIEFIKKSKKLAYPQTVYPGLSVSWSLFYFKLLEEAKPELAKEYVLYGVYAENNYSIDFFDDYRNGYYMNSILSFIQNHQNPNLRTVQLKFAAALQLYEISRAKYETVALELSLHYLDYLTVHHPKEKWESGFHLSEFKDTDLSYIPFSSCAFHILFKRDSSKALSALNDFFAKKVFVPLNTIHVIHHHLGREAFPFVEMAILSDNGGIDHYRRLIGFMQREFQPTQYLSLLWKLAGNKSRPIRELVAKIVGENDIEAERKAIELLENKSADVRQTAALILTQFSSNAASEAIVKVLNKESNDNARDILLTAVANTLPEATNKKFIDAMVLAAKERGKLNKPVEAWLEETALPPLYNHSGKQLDNQAVRFLLYRMSRVKEMRSDLEAKYIIQDIDKNSSAEFALELIKRYIDKGAKPEYKWLIALAALLGNDSVVDKIRVTINKWIDENRYKMAEYGVGALALQGSDKALRWVEWYSRKYKNKKANVGAAALVALEIAAEELGITIHELGDRIVPDFGFDGLFKHFVIDGEEYRAFIDSNFKIAFFNENNKKLKSLPAAAGAELKEEFKAIGKEVRDIVRSQSSRLEYYLIIQRRWNYEPWQKFFLQNPVMFIYATKLLWGVYDSNGKLTQTFLCNEDTSLADINGDEINIDTFAVIGIVYPSQLDATTLQQWKKQFFDLSIESIFPQLDRRMPDLKDIDLSQSIITKFNNRQMVTGSIRSTLERYGWHKGPTGDGGMLESFNLLHAESNIEAILEIEGVGAGYGWGGDEKLGRLYVIDKSKVKQRWFNPPQNNDDDRLVKLKDVPPIFLYEMLAAVESIKEMEKG